MGSRPILGGANSLKMVPDAAQMKIASLFAFLPQDLGVQGLQGCQPQPSQLSKTMLTFKHWTSQIDFISLSTSLHIVPNHLYHSLSICSALQTQACFYFSIGCSVTRGWDKRLIWQEDNRRGNCGAKEPPVIFLKRCKNCEEHKQRCWLGTKSLHNDLCLDLSRTAVGAEFKFSIQDSGTFNDVMRKESLAW